MAQLGHVGLIAPMISDDEYEDIKRDLAARRARRRAGEEPPTWQLPEREPAQAAPPPINVAAIFDHVEAETSKLYSYVNRQTELVAEVIGESTGKNEAEMRKHFERAIDEIRDEIERQPARGGAVPAKLAPSNVRLAREFAEKLTVVGQEANRNFNNLRDEIGKHRTDQIQKLLILKEERESRQFEMEQRIIELQRDLADMRECLRTAGLAAPAARRLSNGSGPRHDA